MSGTGPLLGPPALKRLSPPEVAAGLGELAEGDGEDVVVVGAGEAVVVVGAGEAVVGVVVCCASTVGGASHATRTAKTVKITRATMTNHNKTCIRSVISTLRFRPSPTKDSVAHRFAPLFTKIPAGSSPHGDAVADRVVRKVRVRTR
jgi:hypothetical protein